jgi:hypothetical protein
LLLLLVLPDCELPVLPLDPFEPPALVVAVGVIVPVAVLRIEVAAAAL